MTLGFTLSFGIFAFGACLAFFLWSRHSARLDAEERVSAAVEHLAYEWEQKTPDETIQEVHEDARLDRVSMILVGKDDTILAADGHPSLSWPLPARGWIAQGKRDKKGTVAAGMSWEPIMADIHGQMVLLVAFAALATGAVGGAAWLLVGRTLRPIGLLADGADAASSDPLHAHLVAPSEDAEMIHLVATLNGFLRRLGEGTRSREQFYAAAAHELRTPLAVLSADIEIALSRPRERDEHEETLRELQFQTRRLISLVEGLLMLNRLEMNTSLEEPEVSDPADVAAIALVNLRTTIERRGLRVATSLESESPVSAPPNHVAIVVRNLLENAVRHTSEGGKVEVSSNGAFRVVNDFPREHLLDTELIFEPFVQGDPARSGEGNGLGLAICRRIAEVNGWSLRMSRYEDRVVAEIAFGPSTKS